jgi:hypothetical protein
MLCGVWLSSYFQKFDFGARRCFEVELLALELGFEVVVFTLEVELE